MRIILQTRNRELDAMLARLGFNPSQIANRKRILALAILTFLALC